MTIFVELTCPLCRQKFPVAKQYRNSVKYCGSELCAAKARKQYQGRWMQKNPDYFKGGVHAVRQAECRGRHPSPQLSLSQEILSPQVSVLHGEIEHPRRMWSQENVERDAGRLIQLQHVYTAGEFDDAHYLDATLAAPTTGVLFVAQDCLPGIPLPLKTLSCADARLRVLPI